jgi:hypothetical protein
MSGSMRLGEIDFPARWIIKVTGDAKGFRRNLEICGENRLPILERQVHGIEKGVS